MKALTIGLWGITASIVFGLAPILIAITAGGIGALLGCSINEAGTDPCIVLGIPLGGFLSSVGVLGWLALVTVPLAALAAAVFVLVALGGAVLMFLRRRTAPAGNTRPLRTAAVACAAALLGAFALFFL